MRVRVIECVCDSIIMRRRKSFKPPIPHDMMTHRIENIARRRKALCFLLVGVPTNFDGSSYFHLNAYFFLLHNKHRKKVILGKKEHHERKQKKGDTTRASACTRTRKTFQGRREKKKNSLRANPRVLYFFLLLNARD